MPGAPGQRIFQHCLPSLAFGSRRCQGCGSAAGLPFRTFAGLLAQPKPVASPGGKDFVRMDAACAGCGGGGCLALRTLPSWQVPSHGEPRGAAECAGPLVPLCPARLPGGGALHSHLGLCRSARLALPWGQQRLGALHLRHLRADPGAPLPAPAGPLPPACARRALHRLHLPVGVRDGRPAAPLRGLPLGLQPLHLQLHGAGHAGVLWLLVRGLHPARDPGHPQRLAAPGGRRWEDPPAPRHFCRQRGLSWGRGEGGGHTPPAAFARRPPLPCSCPGDPSPCLSGGSTTCSWPRDPLPISAQETPPFLPWRPLLFLSPSTIQNFCEGTEVFQKKEPKTLRSAETLRHVMTFH